MIRQKHKQEMLRDAKPGTAGREPPLTSQAKNTTMHLNGQGLRLATKNARDSKTPGLHLSATHGDEAAGPPPPAILPVRDGAVRPRDPLLSRPPRPDSEREGENLPPRRPLKLAPLELPKGVRDAQRQKIKGVQLEAKASALKLDPVGNEPRPRKLKAQVREGLVRSPECPPLVLAEPARGQWLQQGVARTSLPRGVANVQRNGVGGHHGDAAGDKATPPPPIGGKPVPPSLAPGVKARSSAGGESVQQKAASRPDAGRRRLRLRRAERLEEDHSEASASAGGLATEGGAPAQRGHGGGQRTERALSEASRVLEKASKKTAGPASRWPADIEVSGRAIRLQDAVAL